MHGAILTGIGSYVPEAIITNRDLERVVDTSDEWIVSHTGMRERHVAAQDQATSDLATIAARRALEDSGLPADDLDLIICATITGDTLFPGVANLVQANLGASKCAAYDLMSGCTGFVYGLAMASSAVRSGDYRHVLVIAADCLTRITNWTDRTTCVLFGDAAGAVVVSPGEAGQGILTSELTSMGELGEMLTVPAGGSRLPLTTELLAAHADRLTMNGTELYKVAVRLVPEVAERVCEKAGLTVPEIDCLIMHQANQRIIDAVAKRLDLPDDRVISILENYGNTSASSMPLALDVVYRQGKLHPGDNVLLLGFGAGFTVGGAAVRWTKEPYAA
jgi:3-oxoacyl-[acyl-carrier-protein] synthase III